MADKPTNMSAAGLIDLRARENTVLNYYDSDGANNCSWGVGTLAHKGPCTAEELARPVTVDDVNRELATRVHRAAKAVQDNVTSQNLTQAQFDALVSFTYNVGASGASDTLAAANSGDFAGVQTHMKNNVYAHVKDKDGVSVKKKLQGLVNRRAGEAAPFAQSH